MEGLDALKEYTKRILFSEKKPSVLENEGKFLGEDNRVGAQLKRDYIQQVPSIPLVHFHCWPIKLYLSMSHYRTIRKNNRIHPYGM